MLPHLMQVSPSQSSARALETQPNRRELTSFPALAERGSPIHGDLDGSYFTMCSLGPSLVPAPRPGNLPKYGIVCLPRLSVFEYLYLLCLVTNTAF